MKDIGGQCVKMGCSLLTLMPLLSRRTEPKQFSIREEPMYYFECEFPNGMYMRVDNISKTEAKRLYRKAMARDFLWAAWDVM